MWVVKVPKKPNATTINPRGLPGDFVYGILNSIDRPKIGNSIDAYGTTYWDLVEYSIEATTRIDSLANSGPYRGVVLRIENNLKADKRFSDPDDASHYIYDKDVVGGESGIPPLVRVKVRVPELHSHLVPPANWGDQPGSHHREINLYPTYVAQDQSVPQPKPGDIVWVDYSNKNDFTDPIYIGPVRRRGFAAKGRGVGGSSRKKVDDPCDEEDATSGASGASGKTPAKTHSASLGYPKGVRTGPEPPPTDGILEEQIVEVGDETGSLGGEGGKLSPPEERYKVELKKQVIKEKLSISGWIGKLGNNNDRHVVVMMPDKTDPYQPVELIIHLHGARKKHKPPVHDHVIKNMKTISDSGRNFILAFLEIRFDQDFNGKHNFFELYKDIVAYTKKVFNENLKIVMNTITCHSLGGLSLCQIANSGALKEIKPDKITLGDADYGHHGPRYDDGNGLENQKSPNPQWKTTEIVWEKYIKDSDKDVEYNLVVISPNRKKDTEDKDRGPLPRYAAQLFVEKKLKKEMPTTREKHYTKELSSGATCYITYAPKMTSHSGIGRDHTITFNGHGPMPKPETPPSTTRPETDAEHVTERPPEDMEEFIEGEDV